MASTSTATVMTEDMLQKCPYCKSKPFVSENNVPGNCYGVIECDGKDCPERPSVMYSGEFVHSSEGVAEWNLLPVTVEDIEAAEAAAQEAALREKQIIAMAKVLDECRWFKAPDGTMEVPTLVWAQKLWEAANEKKSPVQYGSLFTSDNGIPPLSARVAAVTAAPVVEPKTYPDNQDVIVVWDGKGQFFQNWTANYKNGDGIEHGKRIAAQIGGSYAILPQGPAVPREYPVIGLRQRLVVQNKDGKYLQSGGDYPNQWIENPLYATDRSNYADLDTVLLWQKDCEVVEIEVSARMTGRKTTELFDSNVMRKDAVDLLVNIQASDDE